MYLSLIITTLSVCDIIIVILILRMHHIYNKKWADTTKYYSPKYKNVSCFIIGIIVVVL